MDDLINVLIFLVTIVIFGVSAYQKSQKGKKEPVKTNNINDTLEALFGISLDTPKPQPAQAPPAPNPIKKVVYQPIKKTSNLEEVYAEGEHSLVIKTENPSCPQSSIKPEHDFDLKAAFIYSEILNRKY